MVQYDKKIINKLLDTYEASLLSTGENVRMIHVDVTFTKRFIPEYFDQSSNEYENIHASMQQLQDGGFIEIIWKNNKIGHIISKVRLNVERLEQAYAYVKRIPKSDLMEENIQLFESVLEETKSVVCKKILSYLLERLKEHKSIKEYVDLNHLTETKHFLHAIERVEENRKPVYLREFSIQTFHDSKTFETMIGKVHKAFKRFSDTFDYDDQKEWLADYNIYQTPNFVYLKGNIGIQIGESRIDLSILHQGMGISGDDIEKIQLDIASTVKKVLTIENLTTYFTWQEEECLIVYLGGYHNTSRRNLLNKIYATFPKAEYYHFGDIDAGGFEIYRDLCVKTGIPFQMYRMNLDTLKQYQEFGKELTSNDRVRLEKMKEQNDLKDVIKYMLEKNVKLEQECIVRKSFENE